MEILLPLAPFVLFIPLLTYRAGQLSKECPSEEEMFNRLVEARAKRKTEAWARSSLDVEIESKADALARS